MQKFAAISKLKLRTEIEETSEKKRASEWKGKWNVGLLLDKKNHIFKC